MSADDTALLKDVIASIGTIFSMIIAVIALLRSSRQKSNDAIKEISDALNDHILEEEARISKMEANIEYIVKSADKLETKFDKIIMKEDD
jgi:hypothetical protein